jgi:glycosyltransferase involved in cell wall biosynthesis
MPLSVIIPTHRQKHLAFALRGLVQQSEPFFEVLVVENGVRDHSTRDLCARYSAELDLRYVYSSAAGLNRARNLGVKLARHSLIALLDDDCEPDRDWTKAIVGTHDAFSDAGAAGGPVTLVADPVPPAWLVGRFRDMLSELHWGNRQKWLGKSEWLCGANLSFRREVHEAVGGFPEGFGMVGRTGPQLGNDEIVFLRRVLSLPGRRIRYHPGISVAHRVGQDRMKIQYLESRSFGQGFSDLALEQLIAGDIPWPQVWRRMSWALSATHWVSDADDTTRKMSADDRRLHAVNLLRTRVAYLNGLRQRCLAPYEPLRTPYPLTAVESRFYASGTRSVAGLRRSIRKNDADRLVKFALGMLGKHRNIWNRSDETSAATAFGRMAFVLAVVDHLGSRKRKPRRHHTVARLGDRERFLERMLFSGGPRRRQVVTAILDWSEKNTDGVFWVYNDRNRARVSGFMAKIFFHDPFPNSHPIVSVWANGMAVFPIGAMLAKVPAGKRDVLDDFIRPLTDVSGSRMGASGEASVTIPLDHFVEEDVLKNIFGTFATVAAWLRRQHCTDTAESTEP